MKIKCQSFLALSFSQLAKVTSSCFDIKTSSEIIKKLPVLSYKFKRQNENKNIFIFSSFIKQKRGQTNIKKFSPFNGWKYSNGKSIYFLTEAFAKREIFMRKNFSHQKRRRDIKSSRKSSLANIKKKLLSYHFWNISKTRTDKIKAILLLLL